MERGEGEVRGGGEAERGEGKGREGREEGEGEGEGRRVLKAQYTNSLCGTPKR